jgi:hypothetical protein
LPITDSHTNRKEGTANNMFASSSFAGRQTRDRAPAFIPAKAVLMQDDGLVERQEEPKYAWAWKPVDMRAEPND